MIVLNKGENKGQKLKLTMMHSAIAYHNLNW